MDDTEATLERVEVQSSPDGDLQLVCTWCDEHGVICDVESGDSMAVLARTVASHFEGVTHS